MRAAYWAAYQAELDRLDARQCKTGYGCGSSCISLAKDCQKTPKAATGKERLRRISQLAGGEIGEGKGLGRLRQTEAAAKLEQLQGKRSERAKELIAQRPQRKPQEAEVLGDGRKNKTQPVGQSGHVVYAKPKDFAEIAAHEDAKIFKYVMPSRAAAIARAEEVYQIRRENGMGSKDEMFIVGRKPHPSGDGYSDWQVLLVSNSQALKTGSASSPDAAGTTTTQKSKTPKTRKPRQQFEPLTEADRIAPDPPKPVATPKPKEEDQGLTSRQRLIRYQREERHKASTPVDESGKIRVVNASARGKLDIDRHEGASSASPRIFGSRKEAIMVAQRYAEKNAGNMALKGYHPETEYYISKYGNGWSIDKVHGSVLGEAADQPKQPGRQPAAQPKLNEQQRNRMEYINQHGGKVARGMKEAADAFRRPLPKAQRERLGANSVGGVLLKLYDKHARNRKLGLGTTELVQLQKLHEIAGTGFKGLQQDQFQGVQLVKDNAGRWQLYIDGVAKKQMELAEKAASRPGASQKKRRKAAPEPPMSEEMQRAIAHIQMHKEHLKKVNKEIRQLREKIRNATASDNVANMRLEMIKLQDRAHEHQRAMRRTKPRTDSIYQSAYESELQALRRRGAA